MDNGEATNEAPGRERGAAVPWDQHTEGLLRDWHNRAAAAQDAHYKLATQCRRRNAQLGIPAVVLSSVVGTSLFATLSKDSVSSTLRIVVGLVSVLAAVLVGLQTFLRFGERAEKHVVAADWYSAVRRETAEVLALPSQAREPPRDTLDRVRKEMSRVGQQSPEIPARLWSQLAVTHEIQTAPPARRADPL
ncbi:MAG: SLATT domain-containing protein [Actinomycetota bacterium]|nr:SLATT domain-containing protein [Actinomycetota bacterium]